MLCAIVAEDCKNLRNTNHFRIACAYGGFVLLPRLALHEFLFSPDDG
jgi:hypothetical protein